jgi:hypothetical protein
VGGQQLRRDVVGSSAFCFLLSAHCSLLTAHFLSNIKRVATMSTFVMKFMVGPENTYLPARRAWERPIH